MEGIGNLGRSRTDNLYTWLFDVVRAFQAHGGRAWLSPDIYDWIKANREHLPTSWKSTVQATIYAHSSDAAAYIEGNPDVFRDPGGDCGLWELRYKGGVPPNKSSNLEGVVLVEMIDNGTYQSYVDMTPEERRAYLDTEVAKLRKRYGFGKGRP